MRTALSLLSPLSSQEYAFQQSVSGHIWRWKVRVEVSGASPSYYIRDITTPIGRFLDAFPIPGDVVQAMADSIVKVKTAYAPTIQVDKPQLTFEVDEGRGFSAQQEMLVTNSGIFGSLLNAVFVPSEDFITINPVTISGLSSEESGRIKVMVDSSELGPGTYGEVIVIRDETATNHPVAVPIEIKVRPKAQIAVAPEVLTFEVERPFIGPFPDVAPKTFVLTNAGPNGSKLSYIVQRLIGKSPWLASFTPVEGELASGDSQAITVTVKPTENMLRGTYEETLRVSGYSENSYEDVIVRLVVS